MSENAATCSAEIGGGYLQETHPENLFRACSHHCELVSDAPRLPFVLDNAIRAAVGLRGVAARIRANCPARSPRCWRMTGRRCSTW